MERNFNKAAEIVNYALGQYPDPLKHTELNGVSLYLNSDDQHPGMNLDNEYFGVAWRGYEIVFSSRKLNRIEYPDTAQSWILDVPNWLDDALEAIKGGKPAERDYSVQVAVRDTPAPVQTTDPELEREVMQLRAINLNLEYEARTAEGEIAAYRRMLPSTNKVTFEA